MKIKQYEICERFNTVFSPPRDTEILGVSLNVRNGLMPINGLRHPAEKGTSGWYIWAGEEFNQDDDFFQSLHHEHLTVWCPKVIPYLALPAGWRFLITNDYEDVWFDGSLLSSP